MRALSVERKGNIGERVAPIGCAPDSVLAFAKRAGAPRTLSCGGKSVIAVSWARVVEIADRALGGGWARRMIRGAGLFLALHVAGIGVAYASNVAIARLLGAREYGLFVSATTWKTLLLVPAALGLWVGALRFASAYVAQENWTLLAGLQRWSRTRMLASSCTVAALAATLLGDWVDPALRPVLWVSALALPFHAQLLLSSSFLRGFQHITASQVPPAILYPALQLAAFVGFGARSAQGAALADLIALAAVSIGIGWLAWRRTPAAARGGERAVDPGAWWAVLLPLMWIDGVNALAERSDVLMVTALVGPEQAGIYAVSSRISTIVGFGLVAVNAWAAPQFASLWAAGDRERLQQLVRTAARLVAAFTLPAAVLVWGFGPWLLGFFGPEFDLGYRALVVLTCGQLVSALFGPVAYLTTMTGGQLRMAIILSIAAFVSITANALALPRFGFEAAAFVSVAVKLTWSALMAILIWRSTGLKATAW
jgi:O-antigen/teichoic acid export membrane protein